MKEERLDKGLNARQFVAIVSGYWAPKKVVSRHQSGVKLSSVKDRNRPKKGPVAERLATLLDLFSPWKGISLTYRQFAAELGTSVTEAAVKKWPQRKKFPQDIARVIVAKAHDRGVAGVTVEWLLLGGGGGPHPAPQATPPRQNTTTGPNPTPPP